MKPNITIKIISLIMLWFVVPGCSSRLVPDGFPPKLVKFSVTLLCDGKPVEGASIWLHPDNDSNTLYHVSGQTDANGVAVMKTTINVYSETGAPVGQFTGTATHYPKIPAELLPEGWETTLDKTSAQLEQYHTVSEKLKLVPKDWESKKTSPLKINIPENGGTVTIEITDSKTFAR
jgi:hypothetical protein